MVWIGLVVVALLLAITLSLDAFFILTSPPGR